MLALRSVLVIDALDEPSLRAAAGSAADAILIDLAHAGDAGRTLAVRHAKAIARTGRPVLARVAGARSGGLAVDIEAIVGDWLAGIVLAGCEEPQDARDADVQIRKQETRRGLVPGDIALIPEIDSSAALLALPRTLAAIDRFRAIALDAGAFLDSSRLGPGGSGLPDHAMGEVATIADAARLPWILAGEASEASATRAYECGASGVTVRSEGATRGMNSLFTPQPEDVDRARALVSGQDAPRRRGAPPAPTLDRRALRRARALVALADAIASREAIT